MHGRHVDRDELYRLIHALRVRQGWTMQQFLAHAGLKPSLVYYVLAGTRQPSLVTASKMAKVLECSIEDFTAPTQEGSTDDQLRT